MPLNSDVVEYPYSADQFSIGDATLVGDVYQYTESGGIGGATSGTVTAYDPTDNSITLFFPTRYGGATEIGTVVANDGNSFLVYGTFTDPLYVTPPGGPGIPAYVYVTNSVDDQPKTGNTVAVPLESADIAYTPACYCRGTLIRTPGGPRPVETLAEGDLVHCLHGRIMPVRWIGRRSSGGRFLRANPKLRPIRFRAGSLGPSTPSRDLLVSPRHSMLIDGALIPAELLVNGTTVIIDASSDTVNYVHVELPSHDALWAENALSETFVDDDSRGVFRNAAEWERLYPGRQRVPAAFCAPRVDSGPELEAIRRRLDEIAEAFSRVA